MKAIMIMFDTLSKAYLAPYGNAWTHTKNFQRLAKHSITFDNFYGGSMPCMPARRELHTGKYNFLHRSWGPLEPFDESMVELLRKQGIYTHLCTDHSHYFEDGGATYHNRYDTWEGFRGQEGDRWAPHDIEIPLPKQHPYSKTTGTSTYQHYANLKRQKTEAEMSSVQTFAAGLSFIDTHKDCDHWFLQIESFDPHEPFETPQSYRERYELMDDDEVFNWPSYRHLEDVDENAITKIQKEYAALIDMCDVYLGKILDKMDAYDLWKDTMLIVNTDHGFLLGEHQWLGKNMAPLYNEIVQLPFFLWDPRYQIQGEHRSALCQTLDIPVTLLSYFHAQPLENAQGHTLDAVIEKDEKIHEAVLYGIHGGYINICDAHYTYMRGSHVPETQLYEYTLMPTLMRGFFPKSWLMNMAYEAGRAFTNYIPCMKIPSVPTHCISPQKDLLFDIIKDPQQNINLCDNQNIVRYMSDLMYKQMLAADAPVEELKRMGFID